MQSVAIVTGAARGIGKAITEALLTSGFVVAAVDVNTIDYQHPYLNGYHADLTNQQTVKALFDRIKRELGGVDVLVNNAGTCIMAEFGDTTDIMLHEQMAVNFDSAFYCCQMAIPQMLERPGFKKIVNISSNGAYNFDVFDPAPYRASKAAIDSLTKHLARRHAKDKICVNSIAPAMTRTDLFDVVPEDVLAQALSAMPHGDAMQPEQIAAWVAFLASPAGNSCSGNVIILNQGRDVR
ncbi:MAG: SDR family NAD(P)-dependent oxidoreductase [Roseiflexaceae bacterium]|jgi:NAD(P)-dependent dehydrogenase (short-subunit alcohol dehydrogenase family)